MLSGIPEAFAKLIYRLLSFAREQCYTRGVTVVTVRLIFDSDASLIGWTRPCTTRIEQTDPDRVIALLTDGLEGRDKAVDIA